MFVYFDYFLDSDADNLYARDYFDDTFILTICSSELKIFSFSTFDVCVFLWKHVAFAYITRYYTLITHIDLVLKITITYL